MCTRACSFSTSASHLLVCRQLVGLSASQRYLVMFVLSGGLGIPGFFKVGSLSLYAIPYLLALGSLCRSHHLPMRPPTPLPPTFHNQAMSAAFKWFPVGADADVRTWCLWFYSTPVRRKGGGREGGGFGGGVGWGASPSYRCTRLAHEPRCDRAGASVRARRQSGASRARRAAAAPRVLGGQGGFGHLPHGLPPAAPARRLRLR
jgi:hypothetical protein